MLKVIFNETPSITIMMMMIIWMMNRSNGHNNYLFVVLVAVAVGASHRSIEMI